MDFKKKEIGLLPSKYIVLLFCLFPVTSSRNIDCNGKAFHCLNATHFSICVDFGFGMSITIDDFSFPCPQGTECHIENQHECEIIQTTTSKGIDKLTTVSLHIIEELSNPFFTTESNILTTNNGIVDDKNIMLGLTTETAIQSTGTQGYFTDDLVTPEDVTMNTVAAVTMAHTTKPVTKKRTLAERDLTNVPHNISIDVNEILNVTEETYDTNTLSIIKNETLGEYTTTKTTEATYGIKPQMEAKQNNYAQNTTDDAVSHISTYTTPRTHPVILTEETLLETTNSKQDTFIEDRKETQGVTSDVVTESLVNVELLLPSDVISADTSTKKSKVYQVTETINVSDNNIVNENSEIFFPNLETVTDIASNLLPETVINESVATENISIFHGIDDVIPQVKTLSKITRQPYLTVKQETQTTIQDTNEQEVNTIPLIHITNLIEVTRTDITTEKGILIEETTLLSSAVTNMSEPIADVMATVLPSLDVNDLNVSSNVTISSDKSVENADTFIDKEVSSLEDDKVIFVTSTEKSYPNLKIESISPANKEKKTEYDSTVQPPKFNVTKKPYSRNGTSMDELYLNLKTESSTSNPDVITTNNEENFVTETTSTDMKIQEDKEDNISHKQITPTLSVTEKTLLSAKDQNILYEPIIDRVTEKQSINSNKQNISSKLYTTSVYTIAVDERPNVQKENSSRPTSLNTEKYYMVQTNSDINNNVDTKKTNIITTTTNAYLHTIDSNYFSSAISAEALPDIETPTLVTKLIAPSTTDIQITTTTKSYKLIVNNENHVNVSTILPTIRNVQEHITYPESNSLLTYNATFGNYNITEHVKHTSGKTTPTNSQSTRSPYNKKDIYLSSIKFSESTVNPTSINKVNNTNLEVSNKANFVTEKGYIDEGNTWKIFTSTPSYTMKSNINEPEINSFYKENNGSNLNPKISTATQGNVNIISEYETEQTNNHSHLSTEKYNIVEKGLLQKTIVNTQDVTVTKASNGNEPKLVTISTKNYTMLSTYMGLGQTQNINISSNSTAYVTNGFVDLKNPSVNTISSEKVIIQEPVRSDASTVPTISSNVTYIDYNVNNKENNMMKTNSQQTPSSFNNGHKQSQLSTQFYSHNEVKGEIGHDNTKQNQNTLLANNNQAEVGYFKCSKHKRGKFADSTDCHKFYICIGLPIPMVHYCPYNTVFSERKRQCTKNISHCVRNNEFRCTQEGRFHDYLIRNVYYLCVKKQQNHFNRYKLQCNEGFYLDKDDVKCIQEKKSISLNSQSSNVEDKLKAESSLDSKVRNKSSNSKENKDFHCEEEGKFPHPKSCKKYYICEKKKSVLRRKKKRCDSHEIFNKKTSKCVSSDSYECDD